MYSGTDFYRICSELGFCCVDPVIMYATSIDLLKDHMPSIVSWQPISCAPLPSLLLYSAVSSGSHHFPPLLYTV
jgi:hypothetical protein